MKIGQGKFLKILKISKDKGKKYWNKNDEDTFLRNFFFKKNCSS